MFEKYTKKAKTTIFYSRREAGEYGAMVIDTEHLLLGLLREGETLTKGLVLRTCSIKAIRQRIERSIARRSRILGSVDLPLSEGYKDVLAYAADEAKQLGSEYIDTRHLLLGILREEQSLAAKILTEMGVNYSIVREEIGHDCAGT